MGEPSASILPTQVIELLDPAKVVASHGQATMKEATEEACRHNTVQVRAALPVAAGVARMKTDMAKAVLAHHTGVVEEGMEVEEQEEEPQHQQQAAGTDNSLEATQADTTHRTSAAVAASLPKPEVAIISQAKVADTVSPHQVTIPMDSKVDMIHSLALKDQRRRRHAFFSRYPGYLLVAASRRGRSLICSSGKGQQAE